MGTYMTWGVHNNGWWGEGEIQVLSRRGQRISHHLRDWYRGLFLRLVTILM